MPDRTKLEEAGDVPDGRADVPKLREDDKAASEEVADEVEPPIVGAELEVKGKIELLCGFLAQVLVFR